VKKVKNNMNYGIFVVCIAGSETPINAWLMDYDVDANEGKGGVQLTRMPQHAMQFVSMGDAMKAYRKQSKVQPFRDDGKPNRPLTAYTVEIKRL
jgi:hypothetical protein